MNISILHLSDIHISSQDDPILNRVGFIVDAVKNRIDGAGKVFLLVTGDIALSGEVAQYAIAESFLSEIKSGIEDSSGCEVHIVLVPGNHDCFLGESNQVRDILLDRLTSDTVVSLDAETIKVCCGVQENYFQFRDKVETKGAILFEDELLSIYRFAAEDKEVRFNCFNTSWLSTINEKQGGVFFPISNYEQGKFSVEDGFSVALFHHPYVWQSADNSKELIKAIETETNMVLTGHDHLGKNLIKQDMDLDSTQYIEGRVLQDSKDSQLSEFGFIQIDLDEYIQTVFNFAFDGGSYSLLREEYSLSLRDRGGLVAERDRLEPVFDNWLDEPGAAFTHRHKEELALRDVFVFPDLRSVTLSKAKITYQDIFSSKDLVSSSLIDFNNIIIGSERNGKTTLCKVFFKTLHSKGVVPVYVDGKRINTTSPVELKRLFSKIYEEQYLSGTQEVFLQMDLSKVYLIIDDFDKSKLNIKYKARALNEIAKAFPNVMLTASEFFQLEEMIYEDECDDCDDASGEFKQYKVMQFGHVLRNELIAKWNTIGVELEIEQDELIRKNNDAKILIDSVIGRNLVPSFPVFLLTLLQSIEAGTPLDLQTSSQGYYYNYLITGQFAKIKLKADEINSYYNIVSVLSYEFFNGNIKHYSQDEMATFYKEVSNRHFVIHSKDVLLENLIKTKILEERSGRYFFKYKYVYYYFVAKYISDNIVDDEVRTVFDKMCQRLHNEEFANIIMFLTHHNKDPHVLQTIMTHARGLFSDFEPVKIERDVSVVNDLISEIPKLVLEDRAVEDERNAKFQARDKIELPSEENDKDDAIEYDLEEDLQGLDIIHKVNNAFKTIEILGQIVRNYYGSLGKDDCVSVAEETYLITLRTLKSFFVFIEEHRDLLVKEINEIIDEKELVEKDSIEEASKQFLFELCTLVSYGFIKKSSNAIGSDKLGEVYKIVYEKNPFNSIDLINTSIMLDFSYKFPFNDVKRIAETQKGNMLSFYLLQRMAINHLYMFPVDYKEKQQICDSLSIPMDAQRKIEQTSTQKKR